MRQIGGADRQRVTSGACCRVAPARTRSARRSGASQGSSERAYAKRIQVTGIPR